MISSTSDIRARLRLRHLQLILGIWEQGSLRRASNEIGMTQPAATKALQELEDLLGVTLFERHTRGIVPTVFGEAVTRYARVVFAELGLLREELVAIESGNVGTVRLGAVTASSDLLTSAIVALKRANPKLHITVQIDTSEVLIPALQESQLDLVVGSVPNGWPTEDLTFEPLAEEPLSLVTRPQHPVSGGKMPIGMKELAKYPWIIQPRPSPLREIVDQTFRYYRVALPENTVETFSILATLSLLVGADMIAVLPTSVARHYQKQGTLAIVPARLRGYLPPYGLILRANRRVTPATQIVVNAIRAAAQPRKKGNRKPRNPDI
ncbi:LysR substrate-binding domain-containing protein [Caballeronia sp. LZ029]|uniref:LysR substrate-binding domain-containing protein n=1 Tax=Caballeronia sp. LZ029 TaxID=3038564 RepID=UPI00285EE5C2|nr:LysR substrate-binding domain-containing protein [Caballeronia sp. LZ029]MDR5746583.1 LysR substrate-binding domain-containing protein [Caballeronia sp. LZ029]